jgi:hypothetical protein
MYISKYIRVSYVKNLVYKYIFEVMSGSELCVYSVFLLIDGCQNVPCTWWQG